jgi:hypothetical protein
MVAKGSIGELVNGVSGPLVALFAAILMFFTFYIDFKANVQQKNQFLESFGSQKENSTKQEKVWRVERLKNTFYELLRQD